MKTYQIVIISIVMFALGIFFGVSTTGKALAGQIKEVIVANFPALQDVLIANTEPIDVNVVNQPQGSEAVTFFDNICEAPYGETSEIVDTTDYSSLWFFLSSNDCFKQYKLEFSLDGTNWYSQSLEELTTDLDPVRLDVIGPRYRVRWTRDPSCPSCVTMQGYLVK